MKGFNDDGREGWLQVVEWLYGRAGSRGAGSMGEKWGWDGWNGLGVKGEQVGGESMQVGDGIRGWRKEKKKKEREWATDLWALVWAKKDGFGLKEMGLGRKKWAWEVQWAEWAVAVCSFASEHSLIFWLSFFPKNI